MLCLVGKQPTRLSTNPSLTHPNMTPPLPPPQYFTQYYMYPTYYRDQEKYAYFQYFVILLMFAVKLQVKI